jgi:hypothetical protein
MNDQKLEEQKSIILPDDLTVDPNGTATFTINEEGQIQGDYRGTFTLRCYLSPLDSLAAGRQFRELIGQFGESAGEQDRYLAFCVSQLNRRVVKGPPWWNASDVPGNIPDLNVLSILLDRALTAETVYKQRLTKMKEEALEKAQKSAQLLQESLNPKKEEK